ncbi:MAG TPA: chromosome segregation protein SMC [Gemmatimonadaceae bacterium]|nr:chromosome segregation protein SMC [Gemmatimonadaceae bacterium]
MRLTRLELHGFKSFADQTHLVFEPGVTAIVGPNGCGKSNVSDAVRWVLGEQRARALRGAKMEEVIFQGSSARRPVNVAEVSLHFENDDGALAVPFREVVITRRLSRSGESTYLLNGSPCRLRDIHDMVRGTGLGADSGVVIESKMVDALLSDRPDDRRELFEEAAGVGLYRDRRRTTERRLEETTVDLSRLDDLLAEVQSQVRSLARQRKRAERYAELRSRRFDVELTLASREMAAWSDELVQLESRLAELRAGLPAAEERVGQAQAAREKAHAARIAAETERNELSRMVSAQREEVMRLESELRVAEERQRSANARRQRAEEERRVGEELGSQLAREKDIARAERERLGAELEACSARLAECVEAENTARQALAAGRADLDRIERRIRELREQLGRAQLDGQSAERELSELGERMDSLSAEREHISSSLETARSELALARNQRDESSERAEQAAEALTMARAGAEEARAADVSARKELLAADERLTALEVKARALESFERERVGLAPAAARLLEERDYFGDGAVLGPLSDFISAGAAPAAIVEKFLGATVHAVVVRDRAAAEAIGAWHAEADPGPLLLLPLDAHRASASDVAAGGLAELVDAAEPARGWVTELLGRVHSLDDGGAFVDARGAVWLPGSAEGPGPLRRRAELQTIREESSTARDARAAAERAAEAARTSLGEAEARLAAAGEEASVAQQARREAIAMHEESERRAQRAEREMSNADALAERLSTRREELLQRIATLESDHASLADSLTSAVSERETLAGQLADLEHSQEAAREARTRAQVEEAQAQARVQAAADRERRLEAEVASALTRIDSLVAELTDIEEADSVLTARMGEWCGDLDGKTAALRASDERLNEAETAVLTTDAALEEADRALDEAHRNGTRLADSLHHAELRFTELSGRRTAIRERLEAEWRRPLDEMLADVVHVELSDDELRSELEELRQNLESIGPVNPLAIEEHEEETRRLEFLTGQRSDLAEARDKLQQAIKEIDVTARELFLATFNQVRDNFRHIFMSLFGGGECDIRLANPEAPLDCDIEIHASPRGKRTQRIHLLSSGERALVALSLLFGIFLTKPSPFCLLDEVDAPLDDQNVGRFVRMLNQFKTNTQFIVITHNPRTTTEAADAVYGVTMQEPGVSSFVSVRMKGPAVDGELQGSGGRRQEAGTASE